MPFPLPLPGLPEVSVPDELPVLDAVALAAAIRAGELSPTEAVDVAIARAERVNGELNAIIHPRYDKARAEAAGDLPDGPLRGVPIVVKDLDGVTAGDPYHAGTRHLRAVGYEAQHDSELHARLKAAGAVIIGRTNTPELGLQPTTEPAVYGPSHNPWNLDHSTGGSSGGSAACVAAGVVPIGHAGDGGGSIRIPASECGLVGLMPSRGRHSLGPEAGESWGGLVRRSAVTRTVRDTALVLDTIAGLAPGDPYGAPTPARPYGEEVGADPGRLRIGLRVQPGDPSIAAHPDCIAAVEHAAELLRGLGHEVAPAEHELFDDADAVAAFTGHFINAFGAWTAAEVDHLGRMSGTPVTPEGVEAGTWAIAEMGRAVTALQYLEALDFFNTFTRRMAAWWAAGNDLLLTPTLTEPPPRLGEFTDTPENPLNGLFRGASLVQFTSLFNVTGQPAISLPLWWNDEGLPVGVQLVAAYGREDLLIRVAAQLEQAAPWADRRPPVWAG